jgi:uncharacterized protein
LASLPPWYRPGWRCQVKLRLFPREEAYFDLLEAAATNMSAAAGVLVELVEDFTDTHERVKRLKELEHEGDRLTQAIIVRLNSTFVTPFDREDIHQLATSLDNVLDHIEAAADYLQLHNVDKPHERMLRLVEALAEAARLTADALPNLRRMRGFDTYFPEINRVENEGDRMYRRIIADLFSGKYEALDVLKYKKIIEEVEAAIDTLEDVANTIEGIVLKHA